MKRGGPMPSTPAGLGHGPVLFGVSAPDTGVLEPEPWKRPCLLSEAPGVWGLGTGKRLSPGVAGKEGVRGVPGSRLPL